MQRAMTDMLLLFREILGIVCMLMHNDRIYKDNVAKHRFVLFCEMGHTLKMFKKKTLRSIQYIYSAKSELLSLCLVSTAEN